MRRKRTVAIMLVVIGVLVMTGLAIWIAVGVVSVAGIETPRYEIVSEHDGYEIRQYGPHIVAEVTMEGEFRTAMNGGFRKLADYIFGNNTKTQGGAAAGSEKIEMTAPVLEQETQTGTRVVSFVMPTKYSMDTLPKPNNAEVKLVEVPSKRYAVTRFSGTVSEASAAERKENLLELLKRDSIKTIGAPTLAQYNPPWTPPPMRRNEVMVELE